MPPDSLSFRPFFVFTIVLLEEVSVLGARNISHARITFKHSNRAEWCTSTRDNYPGTISELIGLARLNKISMCSLYMTISGSQILANSSKQKNSAKSRRQIDKVQMSASGASCWPNLDTSAERVSGVIGSLL